MSQAGKIARIIFGLVLLMGGSAIVFADVYFMYRAYLEGRDFKPHWAHIGLGIGMAFIGGYIIVPTLAEQVANFVVDKFGRFVPAGLIGGRRATDPPAPASPNATKTPVIPDEQGRG